VQSKLHVNSTDTIAKKLWRISDVRTDVTEKLFIIRGVQLVKNSNLLVEWNIVVLFAKHFLDSI